MDQKKNKIRKGKERKKERSNLLLKNERKVSFSWPPHPLLFFSRLPLLPTIFFFTSIIVVYLDSFNLDWYPSRLAPMYFFLGTHCDPPTRFFFNRFPLLPTILFVFHKHHRLFGFILNFIFIDIHRDLCLCASFLVRIAGGGAAPSPLHPPTRFYFLIDFPCYLLSFIFS